MSLQIIGRRITLEKQTRDLPRRVTTNEHTTKSRKCENPSGRNRIQSDSRGRLPKVYSSETGRGQFQTQDDIKAKLEELRKLYRSIEDLWNSKIAEQENEKERIITEKILEKTQKIQHLEMRFSPHSREEAHHVQIGKMQQKVEQLKSEGKIAEVDTLTKQIKHVQISTPSSVDFTQMRELQARQKDLSDVYERKIADIKVKFNFVIKQNMENQMKELKPIEEQITSLEKQLSLI